jgi:hypothetical protein
MGSSFIGALDAGFFGLDEFEIPGHPDVHCLLLRPLPIPTLIDCPQ